MVHISHRAVPHIVRALEAAIQREDALNRLPEAERPSDYDAHDLAIFQGQAEYFRGTNGDVVLEHVGGKSISFAMALIPGYVRERLSELTLEEWSALFQVYCQFEAASAHQMIVRYRAITAGLERGLESIVQFPVWKGHDA